MVKDGPLVSICIPTYNGEQYLAEALNSAIDQTYKNLEIIISDDQSSDNTINIINRYKQQSTIPFHVYDHSSNGIGANWNNCIKHANGNYIKFLFQDDILNKDCISRMMELISKDCEVGMVYSKRHILVEEASIFTQYWCQNFSELHLSWANLNLSTGIHNGKTYLKDENLFKKPLNKIGEPTNVLLSKECFKKVGFFNEDMHQALDLEYWYRLMPYFSIGFIDESLTTFRLHDNQASQQNVKNNLIDKDKELYHKAFLKHLFWYVNNANKIYLIKNSPLYKKLKQPLKSVFFRLNKFKRLG